MQTSRGDFQGRRPEDGSPYRTGLRGDSCWLALLIVLASLLPSPVRAELQFDVFVGFDERMREGQWFPVSFEILNDGPSFQGTVLLGPDSAPESQPRTFSIELPTGTRKRVVIPVFSATGRYSRWEARLLDPQGKVVAERDNLSPKGMMNGATLMGALPRNFGGLPTFPEPANRSSELAPAVARLQTEFLPTNPIALEALSAIYLNSEKAADIKPEQVDALLGWLHHGGHLIVAVEQAAEVTALPWLRSLLPFAPAGVTNLPATAGFEPWLSGGKWAVRPTSYGNRPQASISIRRPGSVRVNRPGQPAVPVRPSTDAPPEAGDLYGQIQPDTEFGGATMPVMTGQNLGAEVLIAHGDVPLMLTAPRGRGTVTVLAFSPEREPFRNWKHRSLFWARLAGVPPEVIRADGQFRVGGTSIDGIFGAMLDSRQVRKLPVPALLALLIVYLVVIGPFDQWILKRTGKQMWTWVTFPTYVVIFSGLIYFIGYRLRAGDLEWNEIQVVDQLPRGEGAALRGRTWGSLYSPVNASYRFASEQPFATFRAEFLGGAGRPGSESSRLDLRQPAKGFDAKAYVPVWVNQLYASDWLDAGPTLVAGRVVRDENGARASVENKSELRFERVVLVYRGRVHELGAMAPGGRAESVLPEGGGMGLEDFVARVPNAVQVVNQRRSAFGSERSGMMDRDLDGILLASFSQRAQAGPIVDLGDGFSAPTGFDLNHLVDRGEAVVLAWAPKQSIAGSIPRFAATRSQRDTSVRAVLPVLGATPQGTAKP